MASSFSCALLPFATPENIFSCVADWLDHVMVGGILIASTARRYSTVCVEALNLVNFAKEAIVSMMLCHVEAQPCNGFGIWCGAGRNNAAISTGKFSKCGSYLASILSVEPGWTGRVNNIGARICFEEGEGSLQFPGKAT